MYNTPYKPIVKIQDTVYPPKDSQSFSNYLVAVLFVTIIQENNLLSLISSEYLINPVVFRLSARLALHTPLIRV